MSVGFLMQNDPTRSCCAYIPMYEVNQTQKPPLSEQWMEKYVALR